MQFNKVLLCFGFLVDQKLFKDVTLDLEVNNIFPANLTIRKQNNSVNMVVIKWLPEKNSSSLPLLHIA